MRSLSSLSFASPLLPKVYISLLLFFPIQNGSYKSFLKRSSKVEVLRAYAMKLVGTPYKYGGENPMSGFDCSGLVIELYKSMGILPHGFDGTAQKIYNLFEMNSTHNSYGIGSLVFYGESVTKITHVAMMLDKSQPWRIIEAGSGTSKTLTKDDADNSNAYVRIRPIGYRSDKVAILRPNYFTSYP